MRCIVGMKCLVYFGNFVILMVALVMMASVMVALVMVTSVLLSSGLLRVIIAVDRAISVTANGFAATALIVGAACGFCEKVIFGYTFHRNIVYYQLAVLVVIR